MGHRSRRALRRAALVIALLAGLWAVAVAVTGVQTARTLQTVASSARSLMESVGNGAWEEAEQQADGLAAEAERSAALTQRWPWQAAGAVPILGDQVAAVTAAADAAHSLGALAPTSVERVRLLAEGDLVSDDGGLDLESLRESVPLVQQLAARTTSAREDLEQVQRGRLLPPLREQVESVTAQLSDVEQPLHRAATLLPVVPGMLGAEGPRRYLVGFTNPAEVRPIQGIVGAYAVLTADGGQLHIDGAGTDDHLYEARADPRSLGPEFLARYGMDPALVQNVTLAVDGGDAGRLLSDLWVDAGGDRPDGVMFLDPVGVAQILADHPDLPVPGVGEVPVADLPELLLHDAYVRYEGDQEARKAFLTAVTMTAFAAVLDEGIDRATVEGAVDAVRSGHLVVYSAHPEEQSALAAVGAANALPPPSSEARLYLTNADPSKLDYWLSAEAELAPACNEGAPAAVTLRLRNDVPEEIPSYMARVREEEMSRTARRTVALYLPGDAEVAAANVDGAPLGLARREERGWQVQIATVEIPPGEVVTVTWYVVGEAGSSPTKIHLQPLLNSEGAAVSSTCWGRAGT